MYVISHFLSTWNSRVFEFGALLYLATIYPGTLLLPMSVYAFTRGVAAIISAPAIGQYVDRGNRLQVVRVSIVVQRLSVAGSCAIFYLMAKNVDLELGGYNKMLVLLAILACVEKLCSIMNLVSVEKDWVVVVAAPYHQTAPKTITAQMRRIDLLCKLFGPFFIAIINGASTEVAIIVSFAMNLIPIFIEYSAIAKVYCEGSQLQGPKSTPVPQLPSETQWYEQESRLSHNWRHVCTVIEKSGTDFCFYFGHHAFLPSFVGALLYLTVVNFSGQMVIYLLSAGYTSTQVGIARTVSILFEVIATWVAPWLMSIIGPTRAGLWHSDWQVVTLVVGLVVFWAYFIKQPVFSASGLVIGTILSRLGLRGLNIYVQVIVQQEVEAANRGAFFAH